MAQVEPIANETSKTPEQNGIQPNADAENFLELLEKEKSKAVPPATIVPSMMQGFFDVPSSFTSDASNSTGKIGNYFAASNDVNHNSFQTNRSDNSSGIKEQKQENNSKVADSQKEAKADQIKFTANAISKIAAGEMDVSPDLYSAAIAAKNRIASLREISVDDLIAQIKDKVKFLLQGGASELSVELKPDGLGTILMSVSSSKGVLSINIYADQAVKQALEEHINELERSLRSANLNFNKLNILASEKKEYYKG
jgi:flagellar hook-length control protein FliK